MIGPTRLRRGRSLATSVALTALLASACTGAGSQGPGISGTASETAPTPPTVRVSPAPVVGLAPSAGGQAMMVTVTLGSGHRRPPQVFVDTDDDRGTGMWTFQSPLSASGWDLLVDEDGELYRHDGPANAWRWRAVDAPGFRRLVATGQVHLFIPASVLKGSPLRLRVAAEAGGEWFPAAFLPGVGAMPESPPARPHQPGPPAPLAIFYGPSPWLVRDCQPTDPVGCAAAAFGQFAHVVLNSGFEEVDHPAHARVTALVQEVRAVAPATEVWGYVSLVGGPVTRGGVRPVLHTVDDIRARAAAWKAMGATGIFLDEADLCRPARDRCPKDASGKEFEVSRGRQAAAVGAIHDLGMPVFANGFAVPDVLGAVDGAPSPLTGGRDGRRPDMYLLENLTFSAGRRVTGFDERVGHARLQLALRLVAGSGVRLAAVDTVSEPAPDLASGPALFREGLSLAWSAGLDVYGFTNSSYSAAQRAATNLPLPPTDPVVDLARPASTGGAVVAVTADQLGRGGAWPEGRAR